MLQLKIAIQLASLRQPFKKALHTAARLGADAVEIDARSQIKPADLTRTAVRHLRKMMDDLNLRVAAVSFPTRWGYEVAENLQPRIDGTRAAMRMAFQLGANCVVNRLGRIPDSETEPELRTTLRQSLEELSRISYREGAVFAALTGDATPEQIAGLAAELPEGTLHLALDPGEMATFGVKPEAIVSQSKTPVHYCYLSDGTRDPSRRPGMEVPLGRGSVDFPALLGALEERGYHGYLTARRADSENPTTEIAHAIEYIRALFM